MALKSFKYWKRQEVQEAFGLQRVFDLPVMKDFLDVKEVVISEYEQKELEALRSEIERYGTEWNEAALKVLFLGPLLRLVNFHIGIYNPFLEHSLTVQIGEDTASGKVDFMVARGEQIPSAPYFCLQEHKPEEGTSNDPYGQLLIAMMAAQQANQALGLHIPLFGMYNLGNIFYFVALDGKSFMRSEPLAASTSEILDIFKIMRKSKITVQEVELA
ncbi:MAG: hypothetical protein AAGJ18_12525 [Bacteroidota bacterium]